MILHGKGFKSAPVGAVSTIRFACPKGFLEVNADVTSDTEVLFRTPTFEKYGPIAVEIRLKLGSQSFTNATAEFKYFSVTDNRRTVSFGPGVLEGNAVGVPTVFIIQAKDKASNDRTCGMDRFKITVRHTGGNGSKSDVDLVGEDCIPVKIEDQTDGTYAVVYTPTRSGTYQIDVEFTGTFKGHAGAIRGSPFFAGAAKDANATSNLLEGPTLRADIIASTDSINVFAVSTTKGLGKTVSKEDMQSLISVKEHLRNVARRKTELENTVAANRAALHYLKSRNGKVPAVDKLISNLDKSVKLWSDTKAAVPIASDRITLTDKIFIEKTRFKIEAYEKELRGKLEEFRKLEFWSYKKMDGENLGSKAAEKAITDAEASLKSEVCTLEENAYLCDIFELDGLINVSRGFIDEMKQDLREMLRLWNVSEQLDEFVQSSEKLLWSEIDAESLEDGGKAQLKAVKGLHKCTRWSAAFRAVDKGCKAFLSTIPLIALLGAKAMRPRHWGLLVKATNGVHFTPPHEDPNMLLGGVLQLNLHKISNEVEEICDQAAKEEKMEIALCQMESRWSVISFTMTPYKLLGSDDEIPLLSIDEEDFEALENDQLVVQGMLASRFVAQFQAEVNTWHKSLFNVNEVFLLTTDIQRTWSYLEPLFIHSEEVKRELPEDAARFSAIDVSVKATLIKGWETKNVRVAFNEDGLFEKLEGIQEQLDLCKKSLADFLDGRRRQFPRYYFVSEADLLDILSNGNKPESILSHVPKIYLCTKTFTIDPVKKTLSGRPIVTEFVAGVGSEVCAFEPPVPLDGKVEIYMQTVLDAQKKSIFETVKRSLVRYKEMPRDKWVLAKEAETKRPLDPAQTTLLVLAINYVEEVENVFRDIENNGRADAMLMYSDQQKAQLRGLIKLTQSELSKGDRTRVMVCITMDAHARDIVEKMVRNKVDSVDSFMWQSQLKHKFRVSPPHARYQNRDPTLRGSGGERAEVAICDAILPYDYEYLGNGPRLVITPLTDRIYVTATQALNLKMGCAPAGPAGTGKTETTKDLANALAKLIYVINCQYT